MFSELINVSSIQDKISREAQNPSLFTNKEGTLKAYVYYNSNEIVEGYFVSLNSKEADAVYLPAIGNLQRFVNQYNLTKFYKKENDNLSIMA